ncbi:MAG: DUF4426 domain-containing protein [Gammaproteobacteria bacterium]|nr:DUF4426 domain-containing protein [Gammaproteobacteria bacterium]MBU1655865.1 DUF4426 domain-containing protein [Gammaproteobacteria bacterium]MBU1960608.1 DUF4426 domain-containing protein [Gammaproteobacteria bacterium]
MHSKLPFLGILLLLAAAQPLFAEDSTRIDGYSIHHATLTTDTLAPEIAKAYGITRSPNRGMINISLIKEKPGTTGTATAAKVEVSLKRLMGQQEEVGMREIREGSAIYYLGVFGVVTGEKVAFDIKVTPEGSTEALKTSTSGEFFGR